MLILEKKWNRNEYIISWDCVLWNFLITEVKKNCVEIFKKFSTIFIKFKLKELNLLRIENFWNFPFIYVIENSFVTENIETVLYIFMIQLSC